MTTPRSRRTGLTRASTRGGFLGRSSGVQAAPPLTQKLHCACACACDTCMCMPCVHVLVCANSLYVAMQCTCMHTTHAGVATDKPQAPVAKRRAAVPSRAPGPPSASAGAPQPPQPAQPSATELRAASGDGRCLGSVPRVPLTKEQALQQAHAEGLTLRKVDNKSGYANVSVDTRGRAKPYMAQLKRRGSRRRQRG